MKTIVELHKFFVRETSKYLEKRIDKYGNDRIKWKTKDFWYWERGLQRGSKTWWHYPLSIKQKLYYPIAYFKFMYFGIKDLIVL